ncbi:MAG: hypothetical protein GY737_28305, partial [Desulfobacteraceae bacterium]|nr:hypothetical protein [Desulfobacteraceae bacterium]
MSLEEQQDFAREVYSRQEEGQKLPIRLFYEFINCLDFVPTADLPEDDDWRINAPAIRKKTGLDVMKQFFNEDNVTSIPLIVDVHTKVHKYLKEWYLTWKGLGKYTVTYLTGLRNKYNALYDRKMLELQIEGKPYPPEGRYGWDVNPKGRSFLVLDPYKQFEMIRRQIDNGSLPSTDGEEDPPPAAGGDPVEDLTAAELETIARINKKIDQRLKDQAAAAAVPIDTAAETGVKEVASSSQPNETTETRDDQQLAPANSTPVDESLSNNREQTKTPYRGGSQLSCIDYELNLM